MFGLLVKFENSSDTKLLRTGLLYVVLLCSAAILASFIISSSSASAHVALQNQVSLTSDVYVIRTEKNADGVEQEVLKTPNDVVVIPGDRLKFILSFKNETGQVVEGFKAVNPMPGAVQFSQATEDWAEVSIDGGQNWGKLENLTVETTLPASASPDSETQGSDAPKSDTIVKRAAGVADVTHVRWVFVKSIAANESGELSFEGVVK